MRMQISRFRSALASDISENGHRKHFHCNRFFRGAEHLKAYRCNFAHDLPWDINHPEESYSISLYRNVNTG